MTIDYDSRTVVGAMLRAWLADFAGETVADGLAAVQTSLPSPATAGRMLLAVWEPDGAPAAEIAAMYAALFDGGDARSDDDEDEPHQYLRAMASGDYARAYPDHEPYQLTGERCAAVLTALGGLPVSAILACRRYALEMDPLWPDDRLNSDGGGGSH